MNYAIILAGGVGKRMCSSIPKQFIRVEGKPVIIYTLENFQNEPLVDYIEVVCVKEWIDSLKRLVEEYHLDKVQLITIGGGTGQESIRNGVFALEGIAGENDNVIIHDGIRPLVDQSVLEDVIDVCDRFGNGVTSMPYNEQIFVVNENDPATTNKFIPRETLRRVSTPQAYKFFKLNWAYHKAFDEKIGIYGSSYTNTMMVELGETLHFAKGSDKNIKLTTPGDLQIFRAFLKNQK